MMLGSLGFLKYMELLNLVKPTYCYSTHCVTRRLTKEERTSSP